MIDLPRLEAAIKAAGVETYLIVLKDPDSDMVARLTRGSTIWLLGAADVIRQNLRAEWDTVRVTAK